MPDMIRCVVLESMFIVLHLRYRFCIYLLFSICMYLHLLCLDSIFLLLHLLSMCLLGAIDIFSYLSIYSSINIINAMKTICRVIFLVVQFNKT